MEPNLSRAGRVALTVGIVIGLALLLVGLYFVVLLLLLAVGVVGFAG